MSSKIATALVTAAVIATGVLTTAASAAPRAPIYYGGFGNDQAPLSDSARGYSTTGF
jgi:hypothetical protein